MVQRDEKKGIVVLTQEKMILPHIKCACLLRCEQRLKKELFPALYL